MAYKKEELYKRAIEIAKDEDTYFIEDVVALLGISKNTFYDHFPIDSDEMHNIKKQLNENQVTKKVKLRKKWAKSDNATLQMGLMKLISNSEERKRLNQSYIDHTSDGEKLETKKVIILPSNGTEPKKLEDSKNLEE